MTTDELKKTLAGVLKDEALSQAWPIIESAMVDLQIPEQAKRRDFLKWWITKHQDELKKLEAQLSTGADLVLEADRLEAKP